MQGKWYEMREGCEMRVEGWAGATSWRHLGLVQGFELYSEGNEIPLEGFKERDRIKSTF